MNTSVREFLKIAKIELEELLANIDLRIEAARQLQRGDEKMEHVYLENLAVLRNETCCVRRFLNYIGSLQPAPEVALDALLESILNEFKKEIHECGFAPCALIFAERRLRKACRYVADSDDL